MRGYIAASKAVEARNSLGQIGKDAAAAFEIESVQAGGAVTHRLCPSASRPVPDSLAKVKRAKYQSSAADWDVDKAANAGFACLKFSMSQPQYYQYNYSSTGSAITATAMGDLDGDGIPSTFMLSGKVNATGKLEIAPALLETNVRE
jgi:type IV pilus assembly protein PilA